jgi:hypothetical protein
LSDGFRATHSPSVARKDQIEHASIQSPEFVPDTTSAALLNQMTVRDQFAEMLLERVSTDTRQPDRIADRDAAVLAGKFDDLQ